MALATYADYLAAEPIARLNYQKANQTTTVGRLFDRWVSNPLVGIAPTSPVVPTASLLTGTMAGLPGGVATWVKSLQIGKTPGQTVMLFDRLSHQGGLSGVVTGTVTTNLPTAALTRYTSGVGVFAAISIYATIGTTASTVSVSYTNSAGTAGRTSPSIVLGGSPDRTVGLILLLPLQVGDVGVRSVESVTLAGTTGTAGNYGITLLKPLSMGLSSNLSRRQFHDNVRDLGGMFENISADACLCAALGINDVQNWVSVGAFELIKQV